jgi:hypothetical protein
LSTVNQTFTEKTLCFLEEHIPELADAPSSRLIGRLWRQASSVLAVENGAIVEVFPDGTRQFVKQIDPVTPVTLGQKRFAAL